MKKLFTLCVLFLTGCASVTKGTSQSLSVRTTPTNHAECRLTNAKGSWYVKTPGSVSVHRAYGDLDVECMKKGYADASKKVQSKATAHVAGNIVAGGVIGVGVDAMTGAIYDYPNEIVVTMKPEMKHRTVAHHSTKRQTKTHKTFAHHTTNKQKLHKDA